MSFMAFFKVNLHIRQPVSYRFFSFICREPLWMIGTTGTACQPHTHNHFTALLEFVWDYPGKQVPERKNKEVVQGNCGITPNKLQQFWSLSFHVLWRPSTTKKVPEILSGGFQIIRGQRSRSANQRREYESGPIKTCISCLVSIY